MNDANAHENGAQLTPLQKRAVEIDVAQAFHEVLVDRLGQVAATDLFQRAVDTLAASAARGHAPRYPSRDLSALWDVWSSHLGAEGRLDIHLDELAHDRLRFHVDRCAYADMYRSRDQKEIGIAFSCRRDKPFAEALIPGVVVEQSKTILEGNHRCEFVYTLEDR